MLFSGDGCGDGCGDDCGDGIDDVVHNATVITADAEVFMPVLDTPMAARAAVVIPPELAPKVAGCA